MAETHDADVLLINAAITRNLAAQVGDLCEQRRRRKNVVLVLVTFGGDAHAGYRIARCLLDLYERHTLFLTGQCKSAGTLVAIGAHELVVGRRGELGPLDVQMTKPDELVRRQSGLTATAALSTLQEKAFEAFEHFFLSLVGKSGSTITTRTATHVAVQLTSGLFAPIYEHVDPMHVGEAGLALQVAQHYGQLLMAEAGNVTNDGLVHLTTGFPSHEFVIDFAQVQGLFQRVRQPTQNEEALALSLGAAALRPMVGSEAPLVAYLSTEVTGAKEQQLPGLEAEGRPHAEAIDTIPQPVGAGTADNNGGGTITATESGPAPHADVAALGPRRAPRARRRSPAAQSSN